MGRPDPTGEQGRPRRGRVVLALALLAAAAPAAAGPLPEFEPFRDRLTKRCEVPRAGDSTPEVKGAEAGRERCLKQIATRELDTVLLPLKAADPPLFRALMREQGEWNELMPLACTLLDEGQFLAAEHARWIYGTIIGLSQMACLQNAYTDRAYYAIARREGQAASFAVRVKAAGPHAPAFRAELQALRRDIRAWTPADGEAMGGTEVTREDVERVRDAVQQIERRTAALAASTCANWPELQQALGGAVACAEAMEAYYIQHR
jgi:hypothetical protein